MEARAPQSVPHLLETYLHRIESFLQQLVRHAGFSLQFSVRKNETQAEDLETPDYIVEFTGHDADLLLERHAALLEALEYLVLKAVRLDEGSVGKISFDCRDYRRLRAEELRLTAQVAADRVVETGEPFPLNPMTPRERRIVHLALRDQQQVRTVSEGKGPERRVVIHPATTSRNQR